MCADDIILESLILAEKWRMQSQAEKILLDQKVKIWEPPFHTKNTIFRWKDERENFDVLVYNGGAMSEDGRIVVVFPKTDDIINNKAALDDFLMARSIARNDIETTLALPPKAIVTPFEIFYCCYTKNYISDQFKVLVDKT